MKNYKITVNGNVYDVVVEETNGAAISAPMPSPKAPVVPKAAAAPAATGSKGSVTINAPMPGKVLAIKADIGQAVKKGEVVMTLEAMKMENDIVAPQDGTMASIDVAEGASVEAGSVLATLN